MLICIETHRTSDFPRWRSGPPIPPPPSISAHGLHYPTLNVTLMIVLREFSKSFADITRWLFPY